jgi:hypothetical protein
VSQDGKFVLHPGAQLFIDKRPTSKLGKQQAYKYVDYRTDKVTLQPGESHTDFFDLGAFLPNADTSGPMAIVDTSNFHPVMTFHDSRGNRFHCDVDGIHEGSYVYPLQAAMEAGASALITHAAIEVRRKWLRWLGWTVKEGVEPSA